MLKSKPAAALRISTIDLLGPPLGDQLAGSRILAVRRAGRARHIPSAVTDLLALGRRIEMTDAHPETDYEEIAWAFYRGQIDIDSALAGLQEMFDRDVDEDIPHAVEAHRTATAA